MKLYYSPGACSLSPHIVAREAGLSLVLERVDLKTKKTEKGLDFMTVNPKGYVPTLEMDDGAILTEGPVIVQYLGDRKPDSGLVPPAGTPERYRLQEWLNFVSTELHKQYSPLFNPALPAEIKKIFAGNLERRYGFVAKTLENEPFLMGARFTAADAYLFTVTNWAKTVQFDLSKWPAIIDYQKRIASRPAVQQAFAAEGLKA
ncbi:MAG: glutathione transferase GstA [Gammaproteobacteria bacterium]